MADQETSTLARLSPTGLVVRPIEEELRNQTEANKRRTHAGATERAYRADWVHFSEWCGAHGLTSLPASSETVELYLTALTKGYELAPGVSRPALRYWSIARAYAGIRAQHTRAGAPLDALPGVTATLSGIARELGTGRRAKKPLLDVELIQAIDEACVETTLQVRDVAVLLIGWAGALRRSEICDLNVEDVEVKRDGLSLHLRFRKNDQKGEGSDIGVPWGERGPGSCPVLALKAWMDRSGVSAGPLFRPVINDTVVNRRLAPPAVSRAVKHAAEILGLDPAEYSAHSLRAGLATSAALAGKSLDVIMRTTGHKSERVARSYIRTADVLRITASKGLL